jgi:hypothetical protein
MGHETDHASSHEEGGADALDTSKLPSKVEQDSNEGDQYTTFVTGWTHAFRMTKVLPVGKYRVDMQHEMAPQASGLIEASRTEIQKEGGANTRISRNHNTEVYIKTFSTFYILNVTEAGTYHFDVYYRVWSGTVGSVLIRRIRAIVTKVVDT